MQARLAAGVQAVKHCVLLGQARGYGVGGGGGDGGVGRLDGAQPALALVDAGRVGGERKRDAG